VQVLKDGAVLRDETVTSAQWTYYAAQKTTDGLTGPYTLQVAQISETFGAGLYKRIDLDE
jgi:hypothetical protein